MYGYDEHDVHLADTDQQGGAVRTSRGGLAAARAERGPMTARNRSFTITLPARLIPRRDQVIPAVKDCSDAFLADPIANLGHRGIEKAGKQVPKWLLRVGEPERDLPQAALISNRQASSSMTFHASHRTPCGRCAGYSPTGKPARRGDASC
ncbi:DUF4872 domain-containing protein [Streptosporangium sandarakinum]|uniref:DUF4872 domain-containing protein n=1 Tax=Streptosporangium sandarakinum TaxID=1260955 RepID=UPI00343D51BD